MKKETPLTNLFVNQLRERMHFLKIRQTDLAKYIGPGCTKQKVWSWLTARSRNPNAESVLKIQQWDRLKKDVKI